MRHLNSHDQPICKSVTVAFIQHIMNFNTLHQGGQPFESRGHSATFKLGAGHACWKAILYYFSLYNWFLGVRIAANIGKIFQCMDVMVVQTVGDLSQKVVEILRLQFYGTVLAKPMTVERGVKGMASIYLV